MSPRTHVLSCSNGVIGRRAYVLRMRRYTTLRMSKVTHNGTPQHISTHYSLSQSLPKVELPPKKFRSASFRNPVCPIA